jgi:hypothetical protein
MSRWESGLSGAMQLAIRQKQKRAAWLDNARQTIVLKDDNKVNVSLYSLAFY